ncbi:ABC transporter family substrate-binding protein [Dermabacter hominis]|uniref:ABC transporter family substrate-binding protein n=1 Tax=Dermabacter hominis TaxID=36740 RepID=UPI0021A338F0|nr:ABC transporter family substrate-binding protein [Dermabacter hominis]MCT1955910.1 ABC transporter family substrate-binding protein [Dermabacter hominis]MDU4692139.1 ABC transporter family substrate-binding protein [Dermabacter sp.]
MKITSTRRLFLQGTAITGVAAAVAGCSQKSAEEQKEANKKKNDAAAKEAEKLPSTAWDRLDYEQVADGGTLMIAIGQIPANWNPSHIDGNEVSTSSVSYWKGYTANVKADEKGEMSPNPDYVESAEITSENPQIVTVKFNKKAVWDNDGSPVTVNDLIAEWKALNGENEEYSTVTTQGWESIKEIRAKDDFTAEIEYKTAFPDWLSFTYPSGPKALFETPQAFNTGYVNDPVPGCGPFTITNIDRNGGVVTLERNDKWWGRAPKLEKVIFKVTTQQNMPQSFANGEIDIIDIADGDTLGQAKGRKGAQIQRSNGLTWTHLTMNVNGGGGVLKDIEVRKAIFAAVDRNAVGRSVVEPLEAPVVLKDHYVYMPGQEGYEDSFDGELSGDAETDKAKKILEAAGYELKGDVYEKDGKPLKFSIVIPAETKSNEDRARQVMTNLNQAGFKVDLKTVPSDKYFTDYILKQSFDFATFSWQGTLLAELSSSNTYLPDSNQNYTGFKDEKLNEINKRLQTELDKDKRREVANEYSKQVASGYTVLPFYATPNITGLKEGLVNIGSAQFETVDYTAVGYKKGMEG